MIINKLKSETAVLPARRAAVSFYRYRNFRTIAPEGRLDTITAPELDSIIKSQLTGVTDLKFDLSGLEYISSSGLRVLLSAQKIMNNQGSMGRAGEIYCCKSCG